MTPSPPFPEPPPRAADAARPPLPPTPPVRLAAGLRPCGRLFHAYGNWLVEHHLDALRLLSVLLLICAGDAVEAAAVQHADRLGASTSPSRRHHRPSRRSRPSAAPPSATPAGIVIEKKDKDGSDVHHLDRQERRAHLRPARRRATAAGGASAAGAASAASGAAASAAASVASATSASNPGAAGRRQRGGARGARGGPAAVVDAIRESQEEAEEAASPRPREEAGRGA